MAPSAVRYTMHRDSECAFDLMAEHAVVLKNCASPSSATELADKYRRTKYLRECVRVGGARDAKAGKEAGARDVVERRVGARAVLVGRIGPRDLQQQKQRRRGARWEFRVGRPTTKGNGCDIRVSQEHTEISECRQKSAKQAA
jgi:hypothetical protein